jgi:hypothetical protein
MKAIKITDKKGNVFYVKTNDLAEKAEVVEMSDDAYRSIPATRESRDFFSAENLSGSEK